MSNNEILRELDALRKRNRELETAVKRNRKELQDFAFIVSHDLKAPLRGISSLVTWLDEDFSQVLGEEGGELLDKLKTRTKLMNRLIDGVLKYSRIGKPPIKQESFESEKILLELMEEWALQKHITISYDKPLPVIVYDIKLFSHILRNLIDNAITHLGKPEGHIHVSAIYKEKQWQFCVRDNGIGIEEKHFEKIFKIFQTLKPASHSKSIGVGLTLVKKIVELFGGSVWVESIVGEGSSFFFTIPDKAFPIKGSET